MLPFLSLSLGIAYFIPYVMAFLPLLVFSSLRLSLVRALWYSAGCGFLIDLYTYASPFGFFALNYVLTTLLLHRIKKFFSEENLPPLLLFAAAFSFTSSALHTLLYPLLDSHLHLTVWTLFTDLICMPLLDTFYFGLVLLPIHFKPRLLYALSRNP